MQKWKGAEQDIRYGIRAFALIMAIAACVFVSVSIARSDNGALIIFILMMFSGGAFGLAPLVKLWQAQDLARKHKITTRDARDLLWRYGNSADSVMQGMGPTRIQRLIKMCREARLLEETLKGSRMLLVYGDSYRFYHEGLERKKAELESLVPSPPEGAHSS